MERRVTGPFARMLEKNRDHFNSRFVRARHLNRRLSPDDFLAHLSGTMAPIVNGAAQTDPEEAETLCIRLYDLSLKLFAKGCLGPETRYPMIGAAFKVLFPIIPELILQAPGRTVANVCNALYNLTLENGADERRWLATMKALAPYCSDPDSFFAAGAVVAWRCGMAHFREGALAACESLSDKILRIVFQIPSRVSAKKMKAVRSNLKKNSWFDPGMNDDKPIKPLSVVHVIGGFAGLGGPFVTPPEATVVKGELYLYDDASYWLLKTDAFGATLHRRGKGVPGPRVSDCRPFSIRKDGFVEKGEAVNIFSELERFKSAAATPDSLAVCLAHSHRVFIIAQKEGFDHGSARE